MTTRAAGAADVDTLEGAVLFTDLVGFTDFTDTAGSLEQLAIKQDLVGIVAGLDNVKQLIQRLDSPSGTPVVFGK